jgi:hypothetical protein
MVSHKVWNNKLTIWENIPDVTQDVKVKMKECSSVEKKDNIISKSRKGVVKDLREDRKATYGEEYPKMGTLRLRWYAFYNPEASRYSSNNSGVCKSFSSTQLFSEAG